jgi:hypothetical protein
MLCVPMSTVETITLHSLVRIIRQDVKHADVSNLVGLEYS